MYIDEPEDENEIETTEDENEKSEVENETKEEPVTEPELPAAVRIVQAALQGDAVGVKDIFKAAVTDRIADLVADRKEQIANTLITPDQEEQPVEPEESENEETENNNPADDVPGTESE